MNRWWNFLLTVAAVFQIAVAQNRGLDVSLCLNILGVGCQDNENPDDSTNNLSTESNNIIKNEESSDPKFVIQNGFINCNKTIAAAENIAITEAFLAASNLIDQPEAAAQAIHKGMQKAQDEFYRAGVFVLQCLGKALGLYNDSAKEGLLNASQKLQTIALKILDEMRNAKTLAIMGIQVGGKAVNQSIEAAQQNIQASFALLYKQMPKSYQQAIRAVSDDQSKPDVQRQIKNQNADASAKDSDATAAISQVSKLAETSIKNGADPDLVKSLNQSIISDLEDLGQVAAHVRDYFSNVIQLAETDLSTAKSIYLNESKVVNKRIQEIFTNICLDFGAVTVKSDGLFQDQIDVAFIAVEHGNDEVTYANKIANDLTLLSFEYEGEERSALLTAAIKTARNGKISFDQRIVQGTEKMFNIL